MDEVTVALRIRDLYRFFRTGEEEVLALRGVSLDIARGELVAVAGPSGSGKSTLLACAAGLDEPAGGSVWVGDQRLSHRPEGERARIRAKHIGVVMQSGNLIGHLSLAANIRVAHTLAGIRDGAVAELLSHVGLETRAHALPWQLSGGEAARAAVAVAVAAQPSVLLADEPTGELDGDSEQQVLALLRKQTEQGCGVLVVTHSRRVVEIADRVLTMDAGAIAA